jgi:hypothetical protein
MEEIKMQLSGSEFWSQFAIKVYKAGSERLQDLDIDKNTASVSHPAFFKGHAICSPNSRPILHLNDGDLAEWDVLWRALKIVGWEGLRTDQNKDIYFLLMRLANWRSLGVAGEFASFPSANMFATAIYGGLHALCWHAHFPSHVERLLWRVSALFIAGSGFAVALWRTAPSFVRRVGGDGSRTERIKKRSASLEWMLIVLFKDALALVVVLLLLTPYCAARVFIAKRNQETRI